MQFQYLFLAGYPPLMATLVCLFTLWCISLFAAIHPSLILKVVGDNVFFFAPAMGRQKALNDDEKAVIIKESAKCTTPDAIAQKLGYHVNIAKKFQKDPSPRKKRSEAGISKTVTERDSRNIGRQVRRRPELSSKSIFTAAGLPDVPKSSRNAILQTIGSVKAPL